MELAAYGILAAYGKLTAYGKLVGSIGKLVGSIWKAGWQHLESWLAAFGSTKPMKPDRM